MLFAFIPSVIMIICCILIIRNIYISKRNVVGCMERSYSVTSITLLNARLCSSVKTLICLDLLFPMNIFLMLFFQIYLHYNPLETCRNIDIVNLVSSIGFSTTFIKNTFAFIISYLTNGRNLWRIFRFNLL